MSNQPKDFVDHYKQYKDKILTYMLYRLSFDRDLAEDLTSEVFLKAYEHFDRYDPTKPFKPWIYTIAHHHLVSFFRSHKKNASLDEAYDIADEADFVDQINVDMEMKPVLEKLKTLPDAQQEIITLRYQHGLSHAEIAEVIDKNEGAVRTALSRALSTLKKALKPKQ